MFKIFWVTGAEAVNDVRNFIAFHDVAVLVERRTVKFVDRLIDSNSYRKLFLYVRPSFCSFSECLFVCVCTCVCDCY